MAESERVTWEEVKGEAGGVARFLAYSRLRLAQIEEKEQALVEELKRLGFFNKKPKPSGKEKPNKEKDEALEKSGGPGDSEQPQRPRQGPSFRHNWTPEDSNEEKERNGKESSLDDGQAGGGGAVAGHGGFVSRLKGICVGRGRGTPINANYRYKLRDDDSDVRDRFERLEIAGEDAPSTFAQSSVISPKAMEFCSTTSSINDKSSCLDYSKDPNEGGSDLICNRGNKKEGFDFDVLPNAPHDGIATTNIYGYNTETRYVLVETDECRRRTSGVDCANLKFNVSEDRRFILVGQGRRDDSEIRERIRINKVKITGAKLSREMEQSNYDDLDATRTVNRNRGHQKKSDCNTEKVDGEGIEKKAEDGQLKNDMPVCEIKGKEKNTEAMKIVFQYLDQKTMGICRKVCKSWNSAVIPIYSDKYWISFGLLNLNLNSNERMKKTQSLWVTMQNAPSGLIRKVRINYPTLRLPPILELIGASGSFLTSLTITGPFSKLVVYNVLLKCPNLTCFALCNLSLSSDYEMEIPEYRYSFPNSLKLKSIEFLGYLHALNSLLPPPSYIYRDDQVLFLVDIVIASPNLEDLTTNFGDSFGSFNLFVEGIKDHKEITQNLTRWTMSDHILMMPPLSRYLHPVQDIAFGKKLKFLHFRNFRDRFLAHKGGKCNTSLEIILSHVRTTLETLKLTGHYFPELPNCELLPKTQMEFPLMPNLKTFENLDIQSFRLTSLGFVLNFPNLKELALDGPRDPFQSIFVHPETMYVASNSHYNLEKLSLGQGFNNPIQLQSVVRSFPNLKILRFALFENFSLNQFSLKTMLLILRNLKYLEVLSLNLRSFYYPLLLHEAFKNGFEFLEGLTSLTITCSAQDQTTFKQILLKETILEGICQAKSLRLLVLNNFSMSMKDVLETSQALGSRGIRLYLT